MTIEELKQRKRALGLTNEDLAKFSGVPLGTVQKVMSGATKAPRRETLEALEKVLSFISRRSRGSTRWKIIWRCRKSAGWR